MNAPLVRQVIFGFFIILSAADSKTDVVELVLNYQRTEFDILMLS